MMNKIRHIFSHKLRLSGIRGCMAAGAMIAGIAALAVIGGVNSEDISTVNLETDVIPEETVAQAEPEKKTYSHDMEYFSFEDMEKMNSKEEEAPEAAETIEETPSVNEAVNEPVEVAETSEEETVEENTGDVVSEEFENSTASSEEQETVSDEESTFETEDTASDDEPSEDIDEYIEEYSDNTDNEPEQTEEAAEPEQEAIESVYQRRSAAGGDDDNGGLSSALDLETEDSAEDEEDNSDDFIIVYDSTASNEAVSEETTADEEENDIPEDITLDDEDETEERASEPQEGAISLFDLPEWLTFDENGIPTEYVNVLTGNACAYTAAPDALMSTGKEVFQGYVAVDPDIIPYGSELYIVAEDGEVYGYAIAADTGYSVRAGDIIVDLFMNEYDDCIQWGNKPVYVYVLK